jgi:hypothetical protein
VPDSVGSGLTSAGEPNIGRWNPGPQAGDGGVIVVIDLVASTLKINGYKLALIIGAKCRPDNAVKHFVPSSSKFLWVSVQMRGWHRMSSRVIPAPTVYHLSGDLSAGIRVHPGPTLFPLFQSLRGNFA